ncbi:MAG: Coenzyme F420 hydrogenase/dehydrogenase, beta subunit C-terminal domain [Candidatus Lokiarchaeota archaeon]|nr:Coenzyme F420 hydrogenase/dehydrogenase, beta subunit C-terminal domain [Candidatus Lokiarchaeota archaeon]
MEKIKMGMKNQVKNYLQTNDIDIGFQDLNDLVIDKKNCVFCGSCITLCPRIGMNEKKPKLLEYDPECSTCFRYCPRTYFPTEMFEKELFNGDDNKSYSIGHYQKLVAAKSNDESVLDRAQNGGVVSSLLIHALDSGLIDGVLLTDKDENWFPKPVVARTPKEILSCIGSKYTVSPTLITYREAVRELKLEKLAFVGLPCQIHAVRKLQLSSPLSEEFGKFKLIIGLYCYSNYTYDLLKDFVQGELGIPLNTVKKFDISKGKFYVYMEDDSVKQVPIKTTKQYTWNSCHYCKDFSAEIADISVGSAGTLSDDWNSVILRTDTGVGIFNDAFKTNKIITSNKVDLLKIEKTAFRKKTRITQIDEKTLNTMRLLDISEFNIKTYTTLMSLGRASESLLTEVMKSDKNLVISALNSLIQREWITSTNGSYSVVNPTLVVSNEIYKLRRNLMERIEKLNVDVLPNLESIYVLNNVNQLRHRDNLDSI